MAGSVVLNAASVSPSALACTLVAALVPRAAAASGHARNTPAAGTALPSFAEIYAAGTPTLRHVPAGLRHLWGQVLTRALAGAVHYNDEAAWQELLMLPQTVLCAPLRGPEASARCGPRVCSCWAWASVSGS